MSGEYDDFYPDDWSFCNGFCQVCENKHRCVESPYYIESKEKIEIYPKQEE